MVFWLRVDVCFCLFGLWVGGFGVLFFVFGCTYWFDFLVGMFVLGLRGGILRNFNGLGGFSLPRMDFGFGFCGFVRFCLAQFGFGVLVFSVLVI